MGSQLSWILYSNNLFFPYLFEIPFLSNTKLSYLLWPFQDYYLSSLISHHSYLLHPPLSLNSGHTNVLTTPDWTILSYTCCSLSLECPFFSPSPGKLLLFLIPPPPWESFLGPLPCPVWTNHYSLILDTLLKTSINCSITLIICLSHQTKTLLNIGNIFCLFLWPSGSSSVIIKYSN